MLQLLQLNYYHYTDTAVALTAPSAVIYGHVLNFSQFHDAICEQQWSTLRTQKLNDQYFQLYFLTQKIRLCHRYSDGNTRNESNGWTLMTMFPCVRASEPQYFHEFSISIWIEDFAPRTSTHFISKHVKLLM